MIDFSTIKFGDKVYYVDYKLNALKRKKNVKIIDGKEWFSYDKPSYTYYMKEYTYVGKTEVVVHGEVDTIDIDETKFFIKNSDGEFSYLCDEPDSDWFTSKEDAEAEMLIRQKESDEYDRS